MENVLLRCLPCDQEFVLARLHRGKHNLVCNLDKYNLFFNKHRDCGERLDNFRLAYPPPIVIPDQE